MIDRVLFERVAKYMRPFFSGGVSDALIDKFSKKLGVQLPDSYKRFLKEFGAGGVSFYNLMGIEEDDFSSIVNETEKYRDQINLPLSYVVISHRRTDEYEFLTCLDTSRMNNNECPVVKYDLLNNTFSEYQPTFDDAFNDGFLEVYKIRIEPKLSEDQETHELPAGLGYKACWMTVIGSDRETIIESMMFKNPEIMDYREGLEKVISCPDKVMVTDDFENKNYVIPYGGSLSFKEDSILQMCSKLPTVYGYMTHRVSEAHGFFKVENGELRRLFYQDDDGIISIGERLPEEKKNKINLPATLEESRDKKKKLTRIDEKKILLLAKSSSEVEIGKYPYAPVVICDLDC